MLLEFRLWIAENNILLNIITKGVMPVHTTAKNNP